MDVRDAVAVRVGASGRRAIGQVDAQTVGDREPRAFTDEHQNRCDAEGLADMVAERHAGLGGDDQRGDPVAAVEFADQRVDHARAVVGQRPG